MKTATPIIKSPILIPECTSNSMLDFIKNESLKTRGWHFDYPIGSTLLEEKFPKIDISQNPQLGYLKGICFSLLINIFEKGGKDFFKPIMYGCGISIKDNTRKDNIHTDGEEIKDPILKIIGILNPDWKPEDGGHFIWDKKIYKIPPRSFLIFDPKVPHSASPILTNKKRVAIDYTVLIK